MILDSRIGIELTGREQLTERQQKVLDCIIQFQKIHGYSPSIRELCPMVGLKSTSSVSEHLRQLEGKGYIVRRADSPRAIAVL